MSRDSLDVILLTEKDPRLEQDKLLSHHSVLLAAMRKMETTASNAIKEKNEPVPISNIKVGRHQMVVQHVQDPIINANIGFLLDGADVGKIIPCLHIIPYINSIPIYYPLPSPRQLGIYVKKEFRINLRPTLILVHEDKYSLWSNLLKYFTSLNCWDGSFEELCIQLEKIEFSGHSADIASMNRWDVVLLVAKTPRVKYLSDMEHFAWNRVIIDWQDVQHSIKLFPRTKVIYALFTWVIHAESGHQPFNESGEHSHDDQYWTYRPTYVNYANFALTHKFSLLCNYWLLYDMHIHGVICYHYVTGDFKLSSMAGFAEKLNDPKFRLSEIHSGVEFSAIRAGKTAIVTTTGSTLLIEDGRLSESLVDHIFDHLVILGIRNLDEEKNILANIKTAPKLHVYYLLTQNEFTKMFSTRQARPLVQKRQD